MDALLILRVQTIKPSSLYAMANGQSPGKGMEDFGTFYSVACNLYQSGGKGWLSGTNSQDLGQIQTACNELFLMALGQFLHRPFCTKGLATAANGLSMDQLQGPTSPQAFRALGRAGHVFGKAPLHIRGDARIEMAIGEPQQVQVPLGLAGGGLIGH